MLRQARSILVVCGSDANLEACKFFANALQSDLADTPIRVSFAFRDEDLVQSFYVLPVLIPFTDVTLRLIENGPPSATKLYVGGFCFDSHAQDEKGFQLPRWVQTENGTEAGPLEKDRADAARALARQFSNYWHMTVK